MRNKIKAWNRTLRGNYKKNQELLLLLLLLWSVRFLLVWLLFVEQCGLVMTKTHCC